MRLLIPPGAADADQRARDPRAVARRVEPEGTSCPVLPSNGERDHDEGADHDADQGQDERDNDETGHDGLRTLPRRSPLRLLPKVPLPRDSGCSDLVDQMTG